MTATITRSLSSLYRKHLPCGTECVGLGPPSGGELLAWEVLASCMKICLLVFQCKPCATWNEEACICPCHFGSRSTCFCLCKCMGIASVLGKPERLRYWTLSECPALLEGGAVLTPTVEQDWPPSPEELFSASETAPAKRMLVEQSQVDECERERNTRRCLDSNGAQVVSFFVFWEHGSPYQADSGDG